ncbi:hypothetical protein [Mucilaginibacter sp.]|jgi:hypothetical protein|uniref:hypothetical protein n=1 Tax=Mucilaginibacter sp. TaxID=1882438 RepID=UPI0035629184
MKHHGQIVEYLIRRNGYNLSDLAKSLKVNRRTIYNWFKQPQLKCDIIFHIGRIIRHDFSVEFPELFLPEQFDLIQKPTYIKQQLDINDWKDKYCNLLEKYNQALTKSLLESVKNANELFNTSACIFLQLAFAGSMFSSINIVA